MRFVQGSTFVLLAVSALTLQATAVNASAIGDANLLSGATAAMSATYDSEYPGTGYTAVGATDGKCYDASDADKYAILFARTKATSVWQLLVLMRPMASARSAFGGRPICTVPQTILRPGVPQTPTREYRMALL